MYSRMKFTPAVRSVLVVYSEEFYREKRRLRTAVDGTFVLLPPPPPVVPRSRRGASLER